MLTFRDPVHGDLVFDGVIEELILTDELQHLSEVKQLGITEKIYPGANHTRFSHALGVCHIAGKIAQRLSIPEQDRLLIQIAALLHDIGHYDFSHAIEDLALYDHEENGKRIIMGTVTMPNRKTQIVHVLRKNNIDPEKIIELLQKKGNYPAFYYSIISSPVIDADRMDYLKRDTYYTGAVIGEIDIPRLLSVLVVHPDTQELGILLKGVPSLEQFFFARMHMYQQVYMHSEGTIGEAMLRKAVIASKDIATPLMYGDGHLLARLTEQGTSVTKHLISRLRQGKRAYYMLAYSITSDSSLAKHVAQLRKERNNVEEKLCKAAGLADGEILIAFPQSRIGEITPFPVLHPHGTWEDFFAISAVTRTAVLEPHRRTVFAVYSAPEHAERTRAAAENILTEILL